jgi:hypothetical protein
MHAPHTARRQQPDHSPARPRIFSVYSGQRLLGFILDRGKTGFEAFNTNERSLGVYGTQRAAADAFSILEGAAE